MNKADSKGQPVGLAPDTGVDPHADPLKGPTPPARSDAGVPGPPAPLDIQTYIGTRLREVYDDVAASQFPTASST